MARSKAYVDFRGSLEMAAELMHQDVRLTRDPPAFRQQSAVRGLRGGAAVLMVAAFEAFLDDLAAEKMDEVAAAARPVIFAKLPDELRVANVYLTLEGALRGPRYQQSTKLSRLGAIKSASALVARDAVNALAFGGTGGNPGQAAVKDLFKRVGITNIFDATRARFEQKWGVAVAVDFTRGKLDEIVQRRHRVAHRADALAISRVELREAERFLRVFAEVLDIETAAHVRRLYRTCI